MISCEPRNQSIHWWCSGWMMVSCEYRHQSIRLNIEWPIYMILCTHPEPYLPTDIITRPMWYPKKGNITNISHSSYIGLKNVVNWEFVSWCLCECVYFMKCYHITIYHLLNGNNFFYYFLQEPSKTSREKQIHVALGKYMSRFNFNVSIIFLWNLIVWNLSNTFLYKTPKYMIYK